jgi:phage terminase small subunit
MNEKPDPTPPELSVRQQGLMVELMRTSDIQSAARVAGVARSTAYRWLDDPGFASELARRRNEAMYEAMASVKTLTVRAAQELGALLDTEDERLRRQICKDILSHALQVREMEEIERRLIAIEQQLQQPKKENS